MGRGAVGLVVEDEQVLGVRSYCVGVDLFGSSDRGSERLEGEG